MANRLAVTASRQLAGLGHLPDSPAASWPEAPEERFDALVVGAGPAGLGAAEALAGAGRKVLLCERERAMGGRLRCRLDLPGDPPLEWASAIAHEVRQAGGSWRSAPPPSGSGPTRMVPWRRSPSESRCGGCGS